MALLRYLSILFLVVWGQTPVANDDLSIHVQGLFKNTAIVKINGTDRVLKVGKRSPEGVLLKSADARKAIIEYQGTTKTLTMGSSSSLGFDSTSPVVDIVKDKSDVILIRQPDGMFHVQGTINNTHVNFLIDTGASSIAMNHHTANRIGIPYRAEGQIIDAATASGVVKAYRVNLGRVRVGNLTLDNVMGAVLVGEQPDKVLLGMSFLNKFKVEQDGNKLVIATRH